jgi:hypothetical protein
MHRKVISVVKRRPILSLVIGAIAFSTALAFAASLTVASGSLGAGNAAVSSCDTDGISVSYSPTYDSSIPAFKVSSVSVANIAAGCNGKTLKVEVVGTGNSSLASGTETISGTSATVTLSGSPNAGDVTNVHAVIAG